MANVFKREKTDGVTISRNTFDGSFVNNLTLKMGQITPCFLKEVIPGDSFKIDATFGFNFQPLVFPVQTDMQANLHFFYVRNRALWDGWQDFITKTENRDGDSVPPYIMLTNQNRDMFDTGKIGDYLGIPTVAYSQGTRQVYSYLRMQTYQGGPIVLRPDSTEQWYTLWNNLLTMQVDSWQQLQFVQNLLEYSGYPLAETHPPVAPNDRFDINDAPLWWSAVPSSAVSFICSVPTIPSGTDGFNYNLEQLNRLAVIRDRNDGTIVAAAYTDDEGTFHAISGTPVSRGVTLRIGSNRYIIVEGLNDGNQYDLLVFGRALLNTSYPASKADNFSSLYNVSVDESQGIENKERSLVELPFASEDNPNGIRISALPFRAVEAVYNSFYRDDRNNPLIIDGKPYYNVYTLNKQGSADDTHYKLYQRNWEQDVFTTAVQSPQQGVAPLVGVTASGEMTFQDDEGKTYYLQAEFAADGHTITGIKSYSSDMPVGTLRAMVDTISTGISINDFRNVNSLQRWLETNMRIGLRYKDQIEAHFGVSPTYSELDIPEFIGGMSRSVSMNKVVQTSEGRNPLGTLAGNASVLGDGGQPISKFVEEHGWIIGFITVSPKPVYSQQLNKQLLKTELLDYYFPEFAHIGYQPILNQELAPLQCTEEVGKRLQDVFGYQRAWYEYLSSQDEVHGDFRTTMRDYLINRTYKDVPQLGEEFLTISTDEANDVFAVREDDSDKIFGQIYFDVKMKRPIPFADVPRLEVGR